MKPAVSLLVFSLLLSQARADERSLTVESWRDAANDSILSRILNANDAGEALSDVLFDQIQNLQIYEFSSGNVDVDLRVKRRVFDNRDWGNTYTVVDRFQVNGAIPIWTAALDGVAGASSRFGFNIGARLGVEVVNVRQAKPLELSNLKSPEEQKREIENAPWYKRFADGTRNFVNDGHEPVGRWIYGLSDDGKNFLRYVPSDAETQARFGRVWNLVLAPFRLPLTAAAIQNLQVGEILTYIGQGQVELGPSVGWDFDPSGLSGALRAQISYTVFLQGTYRIAMMRFRDEQLGSDNMARVKVTREARLGHAISGGGSNKPTLLDDIFLIKELSGELKIIPFNLTATQSIGKEFDAAYEFNLDLPEAREAYERAVAGRFGMADELAIGPDGRPRDFRATGVRKIGTEVWTSSDASVSRRFKLGFLVDRRSNASISSVNAVIVTPEGERKIHRSVAENSRRWEAFWVVYEKLRHTFSINVDVSEYERDPTSDKAVSLVASGSIQDSHTTWRELMSYILETENAVGKGQIFMPRPAKSDASDGGLLRNFGRSRFNYLRVRSFLAA